MLVINWLVVCKVVLFNEWLVLLIVCVICNVSLDLIVFKLFLGLILLYNVWLMVFLVDNCSFNVGYLLFGISVFLNCVIVVVLMFVVVVNLVVFILIIVLVWFKI